MTSAAVASSQRQRIDDLAHLLDRQFRVPGTDWRFGVDGLIGLIPGVGDAAGLALGGWLVVQAVALGARGATVARMVLNVSIDAVVGAIPVIGSIFDFAYKANSRNAELLSRHVSDPDATQRESARAVKLTIIVIVVVVLVLIAAVMALVIALLSLLF